MDERYLVDFGDEQRTLTGAELIEFVRVAVVQNKDISGFTAGRIEDVDVDEYGNPSYVLASDSSNAAKNAFFKVFNL